MNVADFVGQAKGVVKIFAVDDVEAAKLLFGFSEGTIGH